MMIKKFKQFNEKVIDPFNFDELLDIIKKGTSIHSKN